MIHDQEEAKTNKVKKQNQGGKAVQDQESQWTLDQGIQTKEHKNKEVNEAMPKEYKEPTTKDAKIKAIR